MVEESYTSRKRMADELQELYQKAGYFASLHTRINSDKDRTICGNELKQKIVTILIQYGDM